MKNTLRKALALLLLLAALLPLGGCGASLGAMVAVRRAARALESTTSLSFTLRADGEGTLGGEPLRFRVDGDGVWLLAPFRLRLDAEAAADGLGRLSVPLLLARERDGLFAYTGLRTAGETLWLRSAAQTREEPELDLYTLLAVFEDGNGYVARDPAAEDAGTICLRLTLPGRLLMEAIDPQRDPGYALEDFSAMLWLDKESYLPRRLSAELAGPAQYLLDLRAPALAGEPEIGRLTLELTATAADEVKELPLPAQEKILADRSAAPPESAAGQDGGAGPAPDETPVPAFTADPAPGQSA